MNDKKIILFDLDDTLLDFKKGEANAVKAMFEKYNIPYTKENINLYRSANLKWWHILELGKASKEEILVNRFKDFFESINLLCAGHGTNLTGESPVTGIYRQV